MTDDEPSLEEVAHELGPVLVSMLQKYPSLSRGMQTYYRDAIYWMIRKLPICAGWASEQAVQEAQRLGIPSLKGFWWEHQPRYDKDRAVLHWEHVVPVGDLRDALVRLEQPTAEHVRSILIRSKIAWITKEEDRRLKRSKRLDPLEEYRQAGIRLVEL